MERIVAAPRQRPIDSDQILDFRAFGRDHDLVAGKSQFFSTLRRENARLHHRLMHDRPSVHRLRRFGIAVHELGQKRLIE